MHPPVLLVQGQSVVCTRTIIAAMFPPLLNVAASFQALPSDDPLVIDCSIAPLVVAAQQVVKHD